LPEFTNPPIFWESTGAAENNSSNDSCSSFIIKEVIISEFMTRVSRETCSEKKIISTNVHKILIYTQTNKKVGRPAM
jgi:hypothetical protein